jgi:hypothetical protein
MNSIANAFLFRFIGSWADELLYFVLSRMYQKSTSLFYHDENAFDYSIAQYSGGANRSYRKTIESIQDPLT